MNIPVVNGIQTHKPNNIPAVRIIHDLKCTVLRLAKNNNKCHSGSLAKATAKGTCNEGQEGARHIKHKTHAHLKDHTCSSKNSSSFPTTYFNT
jgi:hypothetical protein